MMRVSQLFGRTLRQVPSDHDPVTAIALRAGLIRLVPEGVAFLPLGARAVGKIADSLFQRVDVRQSVRLPPGDRTKAWCELISGEMQSYRQLPAGLRSHRRILHTDEPRGLGRPRFVSGIQWLWAAAGEEGVQQSRRAWSDHVERWFHEGGWTTQPVEWQKRAYGWAVLSDHAPDALLACSSCKYLAVAPWARFKPKLLPEEPLDELEPISTPDINTIDALAAYLGVPVEKTLKAVFFTSDQDSVIFAVLRGDFDISIPKLLAAAGCRSVTPAEDERIRSLGAEPGYASPVGLQVPGQMDHADFVVIADNSLEGGMNYVAGANKAGFHLTGVNYPRDFQVTAMADIARAREGDACPECAGSLLPVKGFVLGGWQDHTCTFTYADEHGKVQQGFAGQGTLFIEPTLAALLHLHHDEIGILWPRSFEPFDVHLVELRAPEVARSAADSLSAQGLSVLHDDRDVSAGIKFADADLIGLPLRVTASKRSLDQGGVELALRRGEKAKIVPVEELGQAAQTLLNSLM